MESSYSNVISIVELIVVYFCDTVPGYKNILLYMSYNMLGTQPICNVKPLRVQQKTFENNNQLV